MNVNQPIPYSEVSVSKIMAVFSSMKIQLSASNANIPSLIGIFKIHCQPMKTIRHIIWISNPHVPLAPSLIANSVTLQILALNVRMDINGSLKLLVMANQDLVKLLPPQLVLPIV